MQKATDNNGNVVLGWRAMRDSTGGGNRNVVIGYQAGFDGDMDGDDNVILGNQAAANATSLVRNVIIGHNAAKDSTITGRQNVIIGTSGSAKLTSGRDNVVLGSNAAPLITTNDNNILIGSSSTATAGIDNAYAIGTLARVSQADSLVVGGQTGKRFRTGMGGIVAPNAILEVSGTVNVTGSVQFSGSATNGSGHEGHVLKTIGTTVMSGTLNSEHFREMRALEVSGTSNFRGNTYITGNLFVSDIVVAQEFHTEFVSASITFSSGSNKMGDTNDDVQQMTGSFRISGSGPHYFMGRQNAAGASPGVGNAGNAKVGVNTMTPTYELDVAGDVGVDRFIYHNGDTDTHILFDTDDVNIEAGGYKLHLTLNKALGFILSIKGSKISKCVDFLKTAPA